MADLAVGSRSLCYRANSCLLALLEEALTDNELMAPLFVSNEGEITTFSEATSEDDWIDRMDGTVAVRFSRLLVPKPIAVGILRLIRERDEARTLADRYGNLLFPQEKPMLDLTDE